VLVSEEECFRTIARGGYYAILPLLPELRPPEPIELALDDEYSSKDVTLDLDGVRQLLAPYIAEPEPALP
jgi:UDP-glucose 4-epimerase